MTYIILNVQHPTHTNINHHRSVINLIHIRAPDIHLHMAPSSVTMLLAMLALLVMKTHARVGHVSSSTAGVSNAATATQSRDATPNAQTYKLELRNVCI